MRMPLALQKSVETSRQGSVINVPKSCAKPSQAECTHRLHTLWNMVQGGKFVRGYVVRLMNRLGIQPTDDLIEVEEHRVGAGVGGVAIVVVADIG